MHCPGKQRHICRSLPRLIGLVVGYYDTRADWDCHGVHSSHPVRGYIIKLRSRNQRRHENHPPGTLWLPSLSLCKRTCIKNLAIANHYSPLQDPSILELRNQLAECQARQERDNLIQSLRAQEESSSMSPTISAHVSLIHAY